MNYPVTTTTENGKLGNQIIRNLAVSFIAQKHNLNVNYCNKAKIEELGILLFSGIHSHPYQIVLNDDNYFNVLNSPILRYNLLPNRNYFQTKEITQLLHRNLHANKENIIGKNVFKNRYNNNNDVFVHIRLKDASIWNVGADYYIQTIRSIPFDFLFIATDEPEHEIISKIKETYPRANIVLYNEIQTIQFGSTCKNIILSHGSFSAVIGYLAFFSTVYYPEYEPEKMWYGDMFSIPGWRIVKNQK